MNRKKLTLSDLEVVSFITKRQARGGLPQSQTCLENQPTIAPPCTRELSCPWFSEAYTACTCPESQFPGCY
jgi:hypothetical protein